MRLAGISQEVQWNDIDYMDRKRDFTFDPKNFKSLPNVIEKLHSHGQKYVVILDPAIPIDIAKNETYKPLTEGLEKDIFIKNDQGEPAKGEVWPGGTYFPDFSLEAAEIYWVEQIKSLFDSGIKFDGLWIDMNEPSNFVDGTSNGCSGRNDLIIIINSNACGFR